MGIFKWLKERKAEKEKKKEIARQEAIKHFTYCHSFLSLFFSSSLFSWYSGIRK